MANEAADLLFHMLVLLQDAGLELGDVIQVLQARHAS
jgi:phosphoribosyl-ATP pyrophosphohydrolase/phosphoribosyl-AMP cyclohydrolase